MKTVEEVLGRVLNVDPKIITDALTPSDIESWDSFNGLILITELEKNFNLKFTLDDVVGVKNVGDIKKVLKEHGIEIK